MSKFTANPPSTPQPTCRLQIASAVRRLSNPPLLTALQASCAVMPAVKRRRRRDVEGELVAGPRRQNDYDSQKIDGIERCRETRWIHPALADRAKENVGNPPQNPGPKAP
jgi:hypothetical protein